MAVVCNICGSGALISPGLISMSAICATFIAMIWLAHRARLHLGITLLVAPLGLVGAFMGGHLYVVAEQVMIGGAFGAENAWKFWIGSKSVIGAFLGAGLVAAGIVKARRKPLGLYLDSWIPAVALGYAVARLGCFVNGDDFGVVTTVSWGVQFPEGTLAYFAHQERGWIATEALLSLPVHPTQLYHSIAAMVGFGLLLRWRPRWSGERVLVALGLYGTCRLFIQLVRDDHWYRSQVLDPALVLSIGFIVVALMIRYIWSKNRLPASPSISQVEAGT